MGSGRHVPRAALVATAVLLASSLLVVLAGPSVADAPYVAAAGEALTSAPAAPRQRGTAAEVPSLDYDDSQLPRSLRQLAGERWYESGMSMGNTVNCVHQYVEELGRSWIGWFGEAGRTPTTDQAVYYTKIGWGVSGYPCGGGAYVHIEEFLPPGSQLAISQQNPVICWYDGLQDTQLKRFGPAEGCPQQPQTGQQGGLAFDPPDGAWPTATTTMLEIWIPIRSTQPLNGIDGNPCRSCLQAGVWMIDGWNSPWGYPKIPVLVTGGSVPGPTVGYPAPSIRNTTCCTAGTGSSAGGDVVAWFFTTGKTGATEFQIDDEPGAPYDLYVANGVITQTELNTFGADIEQRLPLFFQPDSQYYWRACFTPSGGTKKCGTEQTFSVPRPPDSNPPQTSLDQSPPALSGVRTATFAFSSSKQYSTFRCRLDGGAWEGCVSPKRYPKLVDGQHTVDVKAVSQANVEDSTPASHTWTVSAPPQTTITSAPPPKTRKRNATFMFTSDELTSKIVCKLDDGKWKDCSSGTITYAKLSRAKHTFAVKATDTTGKTDKTPAKHSWTVRR